MEGTSFGVPPSLRRLFIVDLEDDGTAVAGCEQCWWAEADPLLWAAQII